MSDMPGRVRQPRPIPSPTPALRRRTAPFPALASLRLSQSVGQSIDTRRDPTVSALTSASASSSVIDRPTSRSRNVAPARQRHRNLDGGRDRNDHHRCARHQSADSAQRGRRRVGFFFGTREWRPPLVFIHRSHEATTK